MGSFGVGTTNTEKAFVSSIGCNEWSGFGPGGNVDKKIVEIDDPVRYVICGDHGIEPGHMWPGNTAYPDLCCMECAYCDMMPTGTLWDEGGGGENWDWSDCAYDLAPGCVPIFAYPDMITDPDLRRPYARHLGGVNLGFVDGHAAWWHSERLLAEVAEEYKENNRFPMGFPVPASGWWHPPNSVCVVEGAGAQYPTLW